VSTPPEEPLVPPSGDRWQPAASSPPPGYAAQPAYPAQAPPPGYPAQNPYAAPAWPQPPTSPQAGWGTPESRALHEAEAALRKARTALGWAIGAAVGALLALLAAFAVPVAIDSTKEVYGDAGYPLWGEVVGFTSGDALSGSASSFAVEQALTEDGADVDGIDCPDSPAARVSTVIACQGSVDGDDWVFLVHVLDDDGNILITQY
jgi:hypothetical protein